MAVSVKEIMTKGPVCCTPEAPLPDVAGLFIEYDCGAIPVVENLEERKPIGIITDRDMACRAIARRLNAAQMTVRDCMTSPAAAVAESASVEECCALLEDRQVRRVLVTDEFGRCVGIVSQADIARHAGAKKTAEVVAQISKPFGGALSHREKRRN